LKPQAAALAARGPGWALFPDPCTASKPTQEPGHPDLYDHHPDATEELVNEIADDPIVLPNFVPTTPAPAIQRLRRIGWHTGVQVAPPLPTARHVGAHKKRMAITAETPPGQIASGRIRPLPTRLDSQPSSG
jgi:hypothetical protein